MASVGDVIATLTCSIEGSPQPKIHWFVLALAVCLVFLRAKILHWLILG